MRRAMIEGKYGLPVLSVKKILPRRQHQLEARPQRPSTRLGINKMGRAMIEGKCGLPTLACPCRGNSVSLKGGPRTPERRLGNTMMRRMIGRYKGFQCAWIGRASRVASARAGGGQAITRTSPQRKC